MTKDLEKEKIIGLYFFFFNRCVCFATIKHLGVHLEYKNLAFYKTIWNWMIIKKKVKQTIVYITHPSPSQSPS